MVDILKKLTRKELRRLRPGDWVAWGKTSWDNPGKRDFDFWEARVIAHAVRSAQHVLVLFKGLPHAVHKNQLFKVQPIIGMEAMHHQFDYNC